MTQHDLLFNEDKNKTNKYEKKIGRSIFCEQIAMVFEV